MVCKSREVVDFCVFNDMVLITRENEIVYQASFSDLFVKDVSEGDKPQLVLMTSRQSIDVMLSSTKKKIALLSKLDSVIAKWMSLRPVNRNARVMAGFQLLSENLDAVMPLVSRDWTGSRVNKGQYVAPRAITDVSADASSSVELAPYASAATSFQDLSELLNLAKNELKSQRDRIDRKNFLSRYKFLGSNEEESYTMIMSLALSQKDKKSFFFGYKRRWRYQRNFNSLNKSLMHNMSLDPSKKINYILMGRVRPSMTIEQAKKQFYNQVKESPWANLFKLRPLSEYVVGIKDMDCYFVDESVCLNQMPSLLKIAATTLVTPILKLTAAAEFSGAEGGGQIGPHLNGISGERDVLVINPGVLYDALSLIGDTRPFLNANTQEATEFRQKQAIERIQLMLDKKSLQSAGQLPSVIWPEYRGFEILSSKIPMKVTLDVYLPYCKDEKYTMQVLSDATVESIYQIVFSHVYNRERHRTRKRITKFMKRIIEMDGSDSSSDISDQDMRNYFDRYISSIHGGTVEKNSVPHAHPKVELEDSDNKGAQSDRVNLNLPAHGSFGRARGSRVHFGEEAEKREGLPDQVVESDAYADQARNASSRSFHHSISVPPSKKSIFSIVSNSKLSHLLRPSEEVVEHAEVKKQGRRAHRGEERHYQNDLLSAQIPNSMYLDGKHVQNSKLGELPPELLQRDGKFSEKARGVGGDEVDDGELRARVSSKRARVKDVADRLGQHLEGKAEDSHPSDPPGASHQHRRHVQEDVLHAQSTRGGGSAREEGQRSKSQAFLAPSAVDNGSQAEQSEAGSEVIAESDASGGTDNPNDENADGGTNRKEKKKEDKLKKQNKEKSRQMKKEQERQIKEAKRAYKEYEKMVKKKDQKLKKEIERTKNHCLHNGKYVDDFILKVNRASEFLLPTNPMRHDRQSYLYDYDYVRRCINNQTHVELRFVEKSSVLSMAGENSPDIENLAADYAICKVTPSPRSMQILDTNNNCDIVVVSAGEEGKRWCTMESTDTIELSVGEDSSKFTPFFSAFDEENSPYKVKIYDCEEVEGNVAAHGRLFVSVSMYYGKTRYAKVLTKQVRHSSKPTWDEELEFISMRSLPRETKLVFSLYLRTDTRNASNRVLGDDVPLGWVSVMVFEYRGRIRQGLSVLRMWPGRSDPCAVCSENLVNPKPTLLYVDLYSNRSSFKVPMSSKKNYFSSVGHLFQTLATSLELRETESSVSSYLAVSDAPMEVTHEKVEPNSEEQDFFFRLAQDVMWTRFRQEELPLLWKFRNWIRRQLPELLPKVLLAVDWRERAMVRALYEALDAWPKLPLLITLQLLDHQFPDQVVRTFAVNRCLANISNSEIYLVLPQLIQALKFEPYHISALCQLLMSRAYWGGKRVMSALFWQLRCELMSDQTAGERLSLVIEAAVRVCGSRMRSQLISSMYTVDCLRRIAVNIKLLKGSLAFKTAKLKDYLLEVKWPEQFCCPVDPCIECTGFEYGQCRVMGSKTFPLFLTFQTKEVATSEPLQIIYKVGNNLKQDMLVLQAINVIDRIWRSEGLNLCLKYYSCVPFDPECGIIEVVANARTTSDINIEFGGLRAVYSDSTLLKWLQKQNPVESAMKKAVVNFIYSCAGYSVITFILGFADRHNDNIMLSKQGHIFHIDFGHVLGHYRKVLGTYVDKTNFVFTNQYYTIIGEQNISDFEGICYDAYNLLRKHSNKILILFSLMLNQGLPELSSKADVEFIKDRLQLDLTQEEAKLYFKEKLRESSENSTIKLNHAFHVVYSGMRN
ncbi:uncharacterized protein LOC126322376 [Schistocerca gregaria]|uniref:uncharacterized protein LOC126322376 n=1 Tax=Schistocerca gregaria TaxID=7010 RepID=UPI00211DD1D8|nr:uncharacterized protein LOC126322376 [Schistocerca gregaria]